MYVPGDYSSYKYVVSCSDNYIILTNRHSVNADWQNPVTIDIIYQYFKPSFVTIEGERTLTSSQTYEQVDISDNDFERGDFCDFFTSAMLFISVIVFTIINGLSRIFKKGGIIYGQ